MSVFLLLLTLVSVNLFAQKVPLVFEVENRGMNFTKPFFSGVDKLAEIEGLPDPFTWSDESGRSTDIEDWSRRRNEIGAEIQHYEIGVKPERPDTISAVFCNDTLTVNITVKGKTLTLSSAVVLPRGDGPFPAVIGIGRNSGSLPPDIFSSRNIAQVSFNFGQVMAWQQSRGNEPFNELYPGLPTMALTVPGHGELAV